MGQLLPLPERIPYPSDEIKESMEKDGIQILDDSSKRYVRYALPDGWKMVDVSRREDIPDFYIVDQDDIKRYNVYGSWKETYANYLDIRKENSQEKVVRRTEAPESSLTSESAIFMKVIDSIGESNRN